MWNRNKIKFWHSIAHSMFILSDSRSFWFGGFPLQPSRPMKHIALSEHIPIPLIYSLTSRLPPSSFSRCAPAKIAWLIEFFSRCSIKFLTCTLKPFCSWLIAMLSRCWTVTNIFLNYWFSICTSRDGFNLEKSGSMFLLLHFLCC